MSHEELRLRCWERREERFAKKFAAGRRHIPDLFRGLDLPKTPEQFAVLVFASGANYTTVGGARILFAGDIIAEILQALRGKRLAKAAVPSSTRTCAHSNMSLSTRGRPSLC